MAERAGAARGDAHEALRSGTRADHERLDALMSEFGLDDAAAYGRFLAAHAMVLPAVEDALDAAGFADALPDWPDRRRADALAGDIAALGDPQPVALAFPPLDDAAAQWGAAYVIEGSRLGGAFLARQVGADLPTAYLGTPQASGNWRRFLEELDKAVMLPQEIARATATARNVFALFEVAARRQMEQA